MARWSRSLPKWTSSISQTSQFATLSKIEQVKHGGPAARQHLRRFGKPTAIFADHLEHEVRMEECFDNWPRVLRPIAVVIRRELFPRTSDYDLRKPVV